MGWNAEPITDADATRLIGTIRATRKARRIFVKDAATRSGIDKNYWCNLEHLRHMPTVRTLARMADAVGCRLDVVPGATPPALVAEVESNAPESVTQFPRARKAGPNLLRIMDRVRVARERAGLTQAQAAARAGVVKSTWGHLERGYVSARDIGIERVAAAARAVDLTVDAVADHHVPLLELDADEVAKVRGLIRWYRDRAPGSTQFDSIADKFKLDTDA